MPKGLNWKEVTGVAGLEGHWLRRKYFSPAVLQALAERIHASEAGHTGELVLAVEAVSPLHEPDSHARALEVFGRLRVWDTPQNTGVLLYLALDRHHIQVIADRGVTVPDAAWEQVCEQLRHDFRNRRYAEGLNASIDAIEALLRQHTPAAPEGAPPGHTLSNQPVML